MGEGRTGRPDRRTAEDRWWLLAAAAVGGWALLDAWTGPLGAGGQWRRCGGVQEQNAGDEASTERVAQRLSQVGFLLDSGRLGFALLRPLVSWLGRASNRLASLTEPARLGSVV
jgi:hypothetical protein